MGKSSVLPIRAARSARSPGSQNLQLVEIFERSGVLVVAGDVDITTAPQLADELKPLVERGGRVRVICREVSFMAAAGVRVLDDAAKTLGSRGHLVVLDPSFAVLRAIEIVGVHHRIDVSGTCDGVPTATSREVPPRAQRRMANA